MYNGSIKFTSRPSYWVGNCNAYDVNYQHISDSETGGTAYARDLKKIFPAEILPEIDQVYFDGTYEKLDIILKNK